MLVLVPELELELALVLGPEIELVLALDIERYHITASVNHLTCPLPPHQSSFDLPPATTSVSHLTCPLLPHHQSELALVLALEIELALVLDIAIELALDIERYCITASAILLAPCHHISQSFDLPTATTS